MRASLVSSSLAAAALLLANAGEAARRPALPVPASVTGSLTASACSDCQTGIVDVSAGPFGSFLAVWTGTGFSVSRRLFDADGNGGADSAVGSSGQVDLGGVAGGGDGWVLSWFQPGRVWAQRIDGEGGTGTASQVDEAGRGDDLGTAAAAAGDGGLVGFSRTTPGDELDQVVARRVGWDGVPIGEEHVVGEVPSRTSAEACGFADGRSVVVWTTYAGPVVDGVSAPRGAALRRLAADGSPLGPPVVLLPPTLTEFTSAPTVACRPDGSFVAAWNTNRPPARNGFDAVWQRFDANGKAKGKPASLSATTAGDELEPALLARPDGTVLAVWNEAGASGGVLTGRWIAANGKLAGTQFPLHVSAADQAPHRPRLSELPESGRFVLAWWEDLRARVELFRF